MKDHEYYWIKEKKKIKKMSLSSARAMLGVLEIGSIILVVEGIVSLTFFPIIIALFYQLPGRLVYERIIEYKKEIEECNKKLFILENEELLEEKIEEKVKNKEALDNTLSKAVDIKDGIVEDYHFEELSLDELRKTKEALINPAKNEENSMIPSKKILFKKRK